MIDDPEVPSNNEDIDFAKAVGDVKPIQHDRADLTRHRSRKELNRDPSLNYRREAAAVEPERFIDGLSSEAAEIVESEDDLLFAVPGVQLRQLKRLRKGHIPWEQGLDLHGYSVEEARDQISRFIRSARRDNARCVLIVHGKAYSQPGQPARLKSSVNDWLRQLPGVLAFSSAQPKDGGTGAVYVLLASS
ncbi:Smr/MutS family protein [Nitrincola sp. MINF-07-Sa-05]|uniref:Smr/MutS family protein n=1 Tax=Nitrincola salilacus TaxID=3400273 RepID=UPI0039185AB5